jgi:hypothetical protein
LFLVAATAVADAQELKWDKLQQEGRITGGAVVPPAPDALFHQLKVEGISTARALTVLTIDRPSVRGPRYVLSGQVRYEGVEGIGYLELWNHFPDGGQYFTRTLAETGPMMKLSGSSGWRTFTLPFDATGAPPPTRLVFNVVLPGKGVVYLGPLELSNVGSGAFDLGEVEQPLGATAGMLGGLSGALVGAVGALIGVLTSLGRARRFVDLAAKALVVVGTVAFIGGVVAIARSQAYAVYFPLLSVGFVSTVVPLALLPAIRKRYEDIELRRMRAHDVG